MEVLNELLSYPCIKIYQNTDYFNFSIDSILLANFVNIKSKYKKIIDLGTGNAPIPLYLTLKTNIVIDAVEIQKEAYDLAVKSINLNKLENAINIYHDNIVGINKKLGWQKYDVVICNPPFFKYDPTSNINNNDNKTIARHEVLIDLDKLCYEASQLLNNSGVFYMVHRPDRLTDIMNTLRKYNLEPKKIRFVHPKENTEANHVLIEAKRTTMVGGLKVLSPLIVHNFDNTFTKEVLKIYNYKKGN
ncbi:MAG: tRNA1(Val) (adenine(37)-N6)-methyltransferase [Anaeroplasmataceae bacterium]